MTAAGLWWEVDELLKQATSKYEPHELDFPVLFLYRHTLEVYASRLIGHQPPHCVRLLSIRQWQQSNHQQCLGEAPSLDSTAAAGAVSSTAFDRLRRAFSGLLVQPVVQRESSVAVSLDRLGLGTRIPQIVVLEAAGSSPFSHPSQASFVLTANEAFSLEFSGFDPMSGVSVVPSSILDGLTRSSD